MTELNNIIFQEIKRLGVSAQTENALSKHNINYIIQLVSLTEKQLENDLDLTRPQINFIKNRVRFCNLRFGMRTEELSRRFKLYWRNESSLWPPSKDKG